MHLKVIVTSLLLFNRLACLTGGVFLSQGIRVNLFGKIVPTPFVVIMCTCRLPSSGLAYFR